MSETSELESQINKASAREVKLSGQIELKIGKGNRYYIGRQFVQGFIKIERPDITIDGSDAQIDVELEESMNSNCCLFYITPSAGGVRFVNLNIKIRIKNEHTSHQFYGFYNTAYGVSFENCRIGITSDKQVNMAVIYNNGNYDSHFDTRADNLIISNCNLKAECLSEEYPLECAVYGFYNYFANSISVHDSHIYAVNKGNGERQKAVGVFTAGRFGRFVGNNIKSHCTHGEGTEKEHAHAYGMINHGWHTLISANNIVAEWAGMSVGLEEGGLYTEVETNKILATHTIYGRSVRLLAEACILRGNVITSTSRNARLIEIENGLCVISGNILGQFRPEGDFISGCGIYCIKEGIEPNIITENIIRFIPDCGILYLPENAIIEKNHIQPQYSTTAKIAGKENRKVIDQLDAGRIHSITV